MTKERRKVHSKHRHWKEGWVDEFESKFKNRDVELMNEDQTLELKTDNKLLMWNGLEHAETIKGNKHDLKKINKVRKHE